MELDLESLTNNLIEAFQILRNGGEEVNQVTEIISNLCSHGLALAAMLRIIEGHKELYIRHQAVLAINLTTKHNFNENPNKDRYIEQFFALLTRETDQNIRNSFVNRIAKLIDKESLYLAISYCKFSLNSQNSNEINSALQLLDELVGILEDPSIFQLVGELIQAAFTFNDPDIAINAIQLAFNYYDDGECPYCQEKASTENGMEEILVLGQNVWETSILLLSQFYIDTQRNYNFRELAQMVTDSLDDGSIFADPTTIYPTVKQLIIEVQFQEEAVISLFGIMDMIVKTNPDFFFNSGDISQILNRYIEFAMTEYIPEEQLEMTKCDVFDAICRVCSDLYANKNEEQPLGFLNSIWTLIQQLLDSDPGKCVALLLLDSTIVPGLDFYEESLDSVIDIIIDGLSDPNQCTQDAATRATTTFALNCRNQLGDYVDLFLSPILDILKQKPTVEYFAVLDVLVESSETDNMFEKVYSLLKAYIDQSNDVALYAIIVPIISHLCQNSSLAVQNYASSIIPIMQSIIHNESEEVSNIQGDAIECIANIINQMPNQFNSEIPDFAQLLIDTFNSSNPVLLIASIHAYGIIILSSPSAVEFSVETAIPLLMELARQEKTNVMKELVTENIDEPEDIMISSDYLDYPGGALQTIALAMEYFPQFIVHYVPEIMMLISKFSDSVIMNSIKSSMRAIQFISIGCEKVQFVDESVFTKMLQNIQSVIEETTSIELLTAAFDALIHMFGHLEPSALQFFVPTTLDLLNAGFEGNLPAIKESGESKLPIELFPVFSNVLNAVMSRFGTSEMAAVIETIFQLSNSKFSEEKHFALDVLQIYYELSENQLGQDFLDNLFKLGYDFAQKKDGAGFYTIKIFSKKNPEYILSHIDVLYSLYDTSLTLPKRKSDTYLAMIDNCVSSLVSIAMNVVGNDFPLQKYELLFELMPAKIDMEENADMILFLFWALEHALEQYKTQIISVLIRLFARPDNQLEETQIDESTLQSLRQVFVKLISNQPDIENLVAQVLKNDQAKIVFVQQNISATQQ